MNSDIYFDTPESDTHFLTIWQQLRHFLANIQLPLNCDSFRRVFHTDISYYNTISNSKIICSSNVALWISMFRWFLQQNLHFVNCSSSISYLIEVLEWSGLYFYKLRIKNLRNSSINYLKRTGFSKVAWISGSIACNSDLIRSSVSRASYSLKITKGGHLHA